MNIGSSTEQAPGSDSEVLIKPVALFEDPFRGPPHKVVLCEGIHPVTKLAVKGNERAACLEIMEKAKDEKPWFGIEQEYTLFKPGDRVPLGFPDEGEPTRAQGPYYCGSGDKVAFGREVAADGCRTVLAIEFSSLFRDGNSALFAERLLRDSRVKYIVISVENRAGDGMK